MTLAGKTNLYAASEAVITFIYRNPKDFVFSPIRREMQISVFGLVGGDRCLLARRLTTPGFAGLERLCRLRLDGEFSLPGAQEVGNPAGGDDTKAHPAPP